MRGLYLAAPFVGWFVAGSLKFLINTLRERRLAWSLIGYGGMPSTHTSVVMTTTWLIWLREGVDSPALGIAATVAFIVILDAASLRRRIGDHAVAINRLRAMASGEKPLRERMGHRPEEIAVGVIVGLACAMILNRFS